MTSPVEIPVNPDDRAAWLEERRQGIGSSDVAAILGMSAFGTAYSVWVDKVEGLPEEQSDALEWGRRLESAVAEGFADRHPELVVVKPSVMYRHAEHYFMQATPDRLLFTPEFELCGLLEIKTSNYTDAWETGPPDHVLLQVQHQLAVMGLPRAWVACLMFGRQYQEWEVGRDEATIALLVEHEREFWRRVVEQDPPPVDGFDPTTEAIKHLYRDAQDGDVEGGENAAVLLAQRRKLKGEVDAAERALQEVENRIRELIGSRTRLLIDGEPAASWSVVTSEKVDVEALAADHPDLVAQYRKSSTYRRLSIRKGWK